MSRTKEWDQAAVDRAKERMSGVDTPMTQEELTRRIKAGIPTPPAMIHGSGILRQIAPIANAKANLTPRKSTMNKSESAYDQYLDALYKQGRIAYHKFEAVTLRLGDDCRLTMDFLVIGPAGEVEFHDVKAKWKSAGKVRIEDDAKVKLAVAASTCFPFFTFCTVWMENGIWNKKTH